MNERSAEVTGKVPSTERRSSTGRILMVALLVVVIGAFGSWWYTQNIQSISGIDLVWEKTCGGSKGDSASCIVGSEDGGYIVAGSTESLGAGGSDVYLVKIDSSGNLVWERTYGGDANDGATCIIKSGDGGFIVAAWTHSFGAGDEDAYLLKVDGDGNKLWEKTYGGPKNDWASCVVQSGDGGFIAVGGSYEVLKVDGELYLLKVDGDGNKLWERRYSVSGNDEATGVVESGDGGYMVGGHARPGYQEVCLLKFDGDGNKLWEKSYGGRSSDYCYSLIESGDGAFIAAGETYSFGAGYNDAYLLKIDGDGDIIWQSAYGGGGYDVAWSIAGSGDGGSVVAGWTTSFGAGSGDVYLLKVDGDGKKVWEKAYGGSEDEWATGIIESEDGEFMVVGQTNSFGAGSWDVYLLKIREEK